MGCKESNQKNNLFDTKMVFLKEFSKTLILKRLMSSAAIFTCLQTVKAQIRLLHMEQSHLGPHCDRHYQNITQNYSCKLINFSFVHFHIIQLTQEFVCICVCMGAHVCAYECAYVYMYVM